LLMMSAPHSQTKTSSVTMGNRIQDQSSQNQQQLLDRKQKSMAIQLKPVNNEDELSAAPLLLKQNQNRQILRGYESLNDQQ
jgi:hypothetical protein